MNFSGSSIVCKYTFILLFSTNTCFFIYICRRSKRNVVNDETYISYLYKCKKGGWLDLATPQVMGILNVTPDSFYSRSRMQTKEDIAARARQILDEGASIIDIGAYSSRPNAEHISAEEEMRRLRTGLEILNRNHPEAIYFRCILSGLMCGRMCERIWSGYY